MKKILAFVSISILLGNQITVNTYAEGRIRSMESREYVRVSKLENSNLKFESCIDVESSLHCEIIGNTNGYSARELEKVRKKLKQNALAITALDGLIAVVVGIVGAKLLVVPATAVAASVVGTEGSTLVGWV